MRRGLTESWRRWQRPLVLAAGLLALTACGGFPDVVSKVIPSDLLAPIQDEAPPKPDAAITRPASDAGIERVAVTAPPALATLHNLTAADIVALVGEPDFRRVEPPAELWQYRGDACVVDLFLYHQGKTVRVIHVDARDRDPASTHGERCHDGAEALRGRGPANQS
jgi:hypothetical protein